MSGALPLHLLFASIAWTVQIFLLYHHHHHLRRRHHHISFMELGHLLTRSGLTYP